MAEEEIRISPEHLQLMKHAFWTCDNWWLDVGDIVVGENQGFRFWLGQEDDTYAGNFMNMSLGIQGTLSEHVVRKLLPVARAKIKETD